ncbi:MAG: YidC/Oxa1 family membrane protein insertase [Isosphaeraceae bacterium]
MDDLEARQKADIGVEILSRPITVGLNDPVTRQPYRLYAGPKTHDALPVRSPGPGLLPQEQLHPGELLRHEPDHAAAALTYEVTVYAAKIFGGRQGNYGVAIILLTLPRGSLCSRSACKAAMAAKKMQDLQPLLKEIQDKYKDDKEAVTRETFALYRKHGVNLVGGCLPRRSCSCPVRRPLAGPEQQRELLRHASFLYIDNLAAPDMLFKFPFELPFLGEYFNVLPFLVVALMLVQTKLFAPPATTPEAEMQQKMMKYMMVFMAFMFYKVPSGLGLYFITSSLWQICERLLLPKVTTTAVATTGEDVGEQKAGGGEPASKTNGPVKPEKPPGRRSLGSRGGRRGRQGPDLPQAERGAAMPDAPANATGTRTR